MKSSKFSLTLLLPFAIAAVFFAGCSPDEDPASPNGNGNSFEKIHGTYCGPATCEMRYYDAWGNYQYKKTFQYDACLIIGEPAKMSNGEEEDNPFNLIIGPETGHGLEGRLFLTSGQGVGNAQVQAMMNYWQVDWEDDEITGQLTDTHASEGAVFNTLQAHDQWTGITLPKYVTTETTLAGDLDEDYALIVVKGRTTDEIVRFEFTLDALRD